MRVCSTDVKVNSELGLFLIYIIIALVFMDIKISHKLSYYLMSAGITGFTFITPAEKGTHLLLKEPLEEMDHSHEERERILAFILLILAFLIIPTLLFALIFTIIINASYLINFYKTKDVMVLLIGITLAIVNSCLVIGLIRLIKWLKSD